MSFKEKITAFTLLILLTTNQKAPAQALSQTYREEYRPQVHFSPKANWINDPNGMVYYNGVYHLFFQYYPNGTTWGPMHWGHAISTNMITWNEKPIAIYPDSLGYIFSGSAVVDYNNTSGLGKKGEVPLIAIFTQHDPVAEKKMRSDFQNQSIAYSLDKGMTWKKYAHNPVLKNPGITDFRDPKVMWFEPKKKWIMTLATKDRVTFYSSPDLKNWDKESDFGSDAGFHGGVWECPDLFPLDDKGKMVWVLLVNINPGGPNKGSATQYFLGDFDGKAFTPFSKVAKWIDYGPDEYAGITWSNTGKRKIFLGWMSNWLYANLVPTVKWRNAMTLPRELSLKHAGNEILIASQPVIELAKIQSPPNLSQNIVVNGSMDMTKKSGRLKFPCRINIVMNEIKDFSILFSNSMNEQLIIGFNKKSNEYFIDRTKSGKTSFQKDFAARHFAPRFTGNHKMDLTLVLDESSVELFADEGMTVMTEVFFPGKAYDQFHIHTDANTLFRKIEYIKLQSIWK